MFQNRGIVYTISFWVLLCFLHCFDKYIKINKGGVRMAINKKYGYCRVSTVDQNPERQKDALLNYGIDERDIFIDKVSGKNFERDNYILLKERLLRKGDTLVITELDRFGRNYSEIKKEWHELTEKGISIVILDMPIISTDMKNDTTSKLISDIVFSLLAYIAEKERDNIRERQRQGIEIAKAQGKYKGRKKIECDNFSEVYTKWKNKEFTAREAMRLLGIKPNTFYRMVKDYESSINNK